MKFIIYTVKNGKFEYDCNTHRMNEENGIIYIREIKEDADILKIAIPIWNVELVEVAET